MKCESLDHPSKWGIVLVCSFISFIQLGVGRMSGLMYLSALTHYNVSRTQAALPFFLCFTVRNISGPLIGYLGKKGEVRSVILAGCIISSLGVAGCFWAETILPVTILWGGVFGLGLGMSTILLPEVLNQHFKSYITIAIGICLGGECVAGFVMPILIKIFENMYGTSGLFLILSGIMLHSIPAAMILKYRSPSRTTSTRPTSNKLNEAMGNKQKHIIKNENCLDSEKCLEKLLPQDNFIPPTNYQKTDKTQTKEFRKSFDASLLFKQEEKLSDEQKDNLKNGDLCNQSLLTHNKSLENCSNYYEENLQNFQKNGTVDESLCQQQEPIPTARVKRREFHQVLKSFLYSLRLFLDPPFILILIVQSSVMYIGSMLITIIVDFCKDAGLSENYQVYVLMSFSTADLIGRFGLGWIKDGGYMSNNTFFALCHVLMGVFVFVLVYLKNFTTIMVSLFVIGLSLGGILIVSPGVIYDYMERDMVTMALASRYVLFAPMSLTQAPLIGFIRGNFGSYDWIMILMTIIAFVSAVLAWLLPPSTQCRRPIRALHSVQEQPC